MSLIVTYLYTWLTPPSHPDSWFPSGGGQPPHDPTPPQLTCLWTGTSYHLGVTCLRPSITMYPSTTLLIAFCAPPLQPSLAPITPAGLLLLPHPCRFRNRFHRDPHLVLRCLLPPPRQPESSHSLVPRLLRTHIKNRPGGHPLRHCFLSPRQTHISAPKKVPPALPLRKTFPRLSAPPPPSKVAPQSAPTPALPSWYCAGLLSSSCLTSPAVFEGTYINGLMYISKNKW